MNPIFLIDFYKVGHVSQYPDDVTQVWSNWTPRGSRIDGQKTVVHFGLQYFIKKYLIEEFESEFFAQPLEYVLHEYRNVIQKTLGVVNPRTDHISYLHARQCLPIAIYSIPEGDSTPLGVPSLVITNTDPKCYWLPNYLETLLSCCLWKPSTSATTAQRYRKLFLKYAQEAGETDFDFVDWMGHDFSMRGMSGVEDAVLSGMGHLLSFSGTDSLPAILAARRYYSADLTIGGSVPATEHSVMCAGNQDGELETFRRLIEDVYPTGVVSIVSDTWDLWKVLTEYIPALKEKILAREGKIVIRPDSGDPVKIICGDVERSGLDHDYFKPNLPGADWRFHPAFYGVMSLLGSALGTVASAGGELIKRGGAIYGDSITVDRADAILKGLVKLGFSPYNMVFGIGSYTYEYVTRDTYNFAMKATAVRRNGEVVSIFKKPITDSGQKNSLRGIPAVYVHEDYPAPGVPHYMVLEDASESQLENCAMKKVFEDGKLLVEWDFNHIRKRARA